MTFTVKSSVQAIQKMAFEQKTPQFSPILMLPKELHAMIARYLNGTSVGNLMRSHSQFYERKLMAAHISLSLSPEGLHQLLQMDSNKLERFKDRRSAILPHTITDLELKQCIDKGLLNKVRSLNLNGCKALTKKGIEQLQRLPQLVSLSLANCQQFAEKDLDSLWQLAQLEELDLTYCNSLTDSSFTGIEKLQKLVKLNIYNCNGLTDNSFKRIAQLKQLQILELTDCSQLTSQSMQILSQLKNLRCLDLSGCHELDDEAMDYICTMTGLLCLSLADCTEITDEGFARLEPLLELRHLDLTGCTSITEDSFVTIAKLKKLQFLVLVRCDNVDQSALINLAGSLQQLRHLDVYNTLDSETILTQLQHLLPSTLIKHYWEVQYSLSSYLENYETGSA